MEACGFPRELAEKMQGGQQTPDMVSPAVKGSLWLRRESRKEEAKAQKQGCLGQQETAPDEQCWKRRREIGAPFTTKTHRVAQEPQEEECNPAGHLGGSLALLPRTAQTPERPDSGDKAAVRVLPCPSGEAYEGVHAGMLSPQRVRVRNSGKGPGIRMSPGALL